MYHKRLGAYKKIGYEVCLTLMGEKQSTNAIYDYDSYGAIYERDIFIGEIAFLNYFFLFYFYSIRKQEVEMPDFNM